MEPNETRPAPAAKLSNDGVTRTSWILWGMTSAVLIGLTVGIALLYMPIIRGPKADVSADLFAGAYFSLISLAGLVSVFCFVTALRQRELVRLRRRVEKERAETADSNARLSEVSNLFQLSTTLNLHLSLDVVLEIIVRRVVSSLKAQQASIMVYNPESGMLETRATYGLESEFARNAKKKIGEGIAGWVAQQHEAVILDHLNTGELGVHYKNDRNITSALSLPLRVGERCVGVLNVNRINHPERFQERHREMLNLFAEHLGAVIERAETMERMGTRSRELEMVNQQLAETNRMKDMFLSTASHELKTPLTSVIAYAELLDENQETLNQTQRTEFLGRLRGEAERLLALIEDILDLTRIESGKLTLKRGVLSVNEVMNAAIETSRPLADKHDVRLAAKFEDGLPKLLVDEVKLRQAVVNLLTNAIKFSPDSGTVTVLTEREPKYVRLEIVDSGPGIAPDDATHIFELFGQAAGSDPGRNDGVGIGLHLVKRIVELHGGLVGVNSIDGEGSRFWIRLPVTLAADVTEDERAAAAAVVAGGSRAAA